MKKNNFDLPNYIHLSYQGFLDDKISVKKGIKRNSAINTAQKHIYSQFEKSVGVTVEKFLQDSMDEAKTISALASLFSGRDIYQSGTGTVEKDKPFAELWAKYEQVVREKIGNLQLSSDEKEILLEYTKSSAKVINISNVLRTLYGKNAKVEKIKDILVNADKDLESDLLQLFKEKEQSGITKGDWAYLLIQQAGYEALKMTKSLEQLNNMKDNTQNFGQLLGNDYKTFKTQLDKVKNTYLNGGSEKDVLNEVNTARRTLNTKIKGLGTETASFVSLPVIRQAATGVAVDYLHTGTDFENINFEGTAQFIQRKKRANVILKERTLTTTRRVALADVTINLTANGNTNKVKVSKKTYSPKAKEITIASGASAPTVAQAIALINHMYGINFFNGPQAFIFYNALNFLFTGKNYWYEKGKSTLTIKKDGGRNQRAIGDFKSLPAVERSLNTEILSSFLTLAYSAFFTPEFAALYDINGFVVPSPLLFDMGIERIKNQKSDSMQKLISFGSRGIRDEYRDAITSAGSGERSVIHKGVKKYAIYLMALKRNNAAYSKIHGATISVKSYNITNKEYYSVMMDKISKSR